jgi:monovalent cation:H+ antiporter-2, CPA2 family
MVNDLISLGILFAGAIVGGLIAARLRQPAVIGLLLVGAIIGPKALNIVTDAGMIEKVAEFGAILLLFVIGLEFVIPKLVKVGFKALMLTFMKIGIVFFITYETLYWFGFGIVNAIIFGIIVSLSSTVVIVKILQSKNLYKKQEMPLIIAMLIFEDIFAVFALTFLANSGGDLNMLLIVERLIISITVLLVVYIIMLRVSGHIVSWFVKRSGEDAMTFIALGMCAGFSYLAHALGLSPSIGAFLAGSVIASHPDAKRFEASIMPYSTMFTSLFFISIGTMVDFAVLGTNMKLLLILLALIVITRLIGVGVIGHFFANFRKEQIIFSSIAMIAVSEFSLLIARSSSALAPGIDIVSISAALVFITAIIFSLSVSSFERLSVLMEGVVPRDLKNHSGRLSDYIRLSFDEIDTESVHTRKFKSLMLYGVLQVLLMLFCLIGLNRSMDYLARYNIGLRILVFASITALVIYLGHKTYLKMKSAYQTLAIILAGLEAGRNIRKSRYVLNNLLVVFLLVSLIFGTPIIILALDLPALATALLSLVPLGILFLIFIYMKRVSGMLNGFSNTRDLFPRYKKWSSYGQSRISSDTSGSAR